MGNAVSSIRSQLTPDPSLLRRVGNTPLICLKKLGNRRPDIELYAKGEWLNPGGSVKIRPALRMIEEGERSGQLTKDKIILDSTSGNTGIGYGLIGAIKGYQVKLVMPKNVCSERVKIIESYGTSIIFSSPFEGSDGAIRMAHQIYHEHPKRYFMPDQYNNPLNSQAHYDTTGLEIIRQTQGRVTHLVAGIGTSGTIMGVGQRLKAFNPHIKVIGVEPAEPLHGIEGLKHLETSIVPGIYDPTLLDNLIHIKTEDAYSMVEQLLRIEELSVGHSSGAALCGALQVAEGLEQGVVVIIFPDGCECDILKGRINHITGCRLTL